LHVCKLLVQVNGPGPSQPGKHRQVENSPQYLITAHIVKVANIAEGHFC